MSRFKQAAVWTLDSKCCSHSVSTSIMQAHEILYLQLGLACQRLEVLQYQLTMRDAGHKPLRSRIWPV